MVCLRHILLTYEDRPNYLVGLEDELKYTFCYCQITNCLTNKLNMGLFETDDNFAQLFSGSFRIKPENPIGQRNEKKPPIS